MNSTTYPHFLKNPPTNFKGSSATWAAFVQEMFPLETYNTLATEDVSALAGFAHETLEQFLRTNTTPVIRLGELDGKVLCSVALSDRPFIVNTIIESLLAAGIEASFFIHPILNTERGLVSLSLLAIPKIDGILETLKTLFTKAFGALYAATNDYPKMVHALELWEKDLAAHDNPETAALCGWLKSGGLVILGTKEGSTILGALQDTVTLAEIEQDQHGISIDRPLVITKLSQPSLIHKRLRPLHFCFKLGSGTVVSVVGLLTSKARGEESTISPVIRQKFKSLITLEKAPSNSYTYKSIVNLINNMPTEDALRTSVQDLRDVLRNTILSHSKQLMRTSIISDAASREATVLIIIPRDLFSTEIRKKLQSKVEDLLQAPHGSSDYRLDVSDKSLARFYFTVPTTKSTLETVHHNDFNNALLDIAEPWGTRLARALGNDAKALSLIPELPATYQALIDIPHAISDINLLSKISEQRKYAVTLHYYGEDLIVSVASHGCDLTISKATPIFENSGFEVISQASFELKSTTKRVINHFKLHTRLQASNIVSAELFRISLALEELLLGHAPSDPLNSLLLHGLGLKEIIVLRAYGSHLSQLNKFATRHAIFGALAQYPAAALLLWKIFDTKFNPLLNKTIEERKLLNAAPESEYKDVVRSVKDLSHDRILRALLELALGTVRTNAYIPHAALAIKIASEKCEVIPQPRPKFEIYVSAQHVEGVHLRTALVARGGIRWSDRKDDYRTEVLGLVKTQKVKNVVIVPSGSKGGFYVKITNPDGSPVARSVVEHCYQDYIRALLSVTDNLIDGKPQTPAGVIRHDDIDPYLVVAADKGTATFSDLANKVAVEEFNFWLGDAFASGGSQGYDHKKFGITARGAWECTKRHFAEAGIAYDKVPFTVTGIGDMSGDVFGNGLILSDNAKLLAAFDHRSIFIDPSPDTKKSFAERKRLFELKGSSWNDYSKALITKGGGVYGRFDKEIQLSNEARTALGIADSVPALLHGEEVIAHILRAPVDLLWNGGIGTYIKSREESNAEVNDSSNDLVRVNADEVRAKIVAEGGNLGVTSKGRRDYALAGGHINTDAIDNSAGVDLSDHEVNLKILVSPLTKNGTLTFDTRNILLKELGTEVSGLVLAHNATQALTLSLGVHRSKRNIEYYRSLVNFLAREGYINRSIDPLPDDDEFAYRGSKAEGLTRPELALCLACTKMWVKDEILRSTLPEDPALEYLCIEYFPTKIKKEYLDSIKVHPLKKNIIATELSNLIVDTFGISFVHRLHALYGNTAAEVVKAAMLSYFLLDGAKLIRDTFAYDSAADQPLFMRLQYELRRMLRAGASWFLTNETLPKGQTIEQTLEVFKPLIKTLRTSTLSFLDSKQKATFTSRLQEFSSLGETLSWAMAIAPSIISSLELVGIAHEAQSEVAVVAPIYLGTIETLGISSLITLGAPLEAATRWENELRLNSYLDIRRAISRISSTLIERGATSCEVIKTTRGFSPLALYIKDLASSPNAAAGLAVVARTLGGIVRELEK
jgi:glutamate dehydrogenase